MYIFSSDKFGNESFVFEKYGPEPFLLGCFVAIYEDLIIRLYFGPYVCRKKIEILVERRLGRYAEFYCLIPILPYGSVYVNSAELNILPIKSAFAVHV